PYSIDILASNELDYKTVLKPLKSSESITEECLSFGEKNAISLILFSLEASIDYELIILDDPVSSFDNNKKFALLYYLFAKENAAFTNKTVLLFTHDFDIIIDFIYKNEFKNINNKCSFVKNSNGAFSDIEIKKRDVSHTIRMWSKKAENDSLPPLLRVVNLRKYLQYTCPEEQIAIDILSSIEHNDDKPKQIVSRLKQEIDDKEKLNEGITCIKKWIRDFDYDLYLSKVQDKMELKKLYKNSKSSICKLQILRMIINLTEEKFGDKVFWDYLTEYYHVENNEMISLNEKKFDNIPNYIMRISDEIIEDIYKENF
ncbi:ABC transporter ATP-binding protein, partial [Erysipelothrix rhusiopathiae]|nr:ABC transporter ATP-binding protein [Erysipelothrix rhusiopathiae]